MHLSLPLTLTPRPPCSSPLCLLFSDPSPSALTKGMQETHLELIRDKEGGKNELGDGKTKKEKNEQVRKRARMKSRQSARTGLSQLFLENEK